ncbi:uncharacterized protein LY89DRAFT_758265 [Mollisia scopiformis]|uniref:Uncharacterized protein n=1 Tax=Mollisia scopiformis TaxID=149040 RepID=A0A194WUB9_MOLSC|nr:uncharacterized protein LY89DRAFT_758265 [Mollisia scopiformis]KUJ11556.1 hypothetical protein LY89DRAFT_758265 [Mollisia scopiformis]
MPPQPVGHCLLWALLHITILFSQIVHATPTVSLIESLQPTRTRHVLEARGSVTFPSYQANPSTILWPPNCATTDPDACLGSNSVKSCTVKYCSKMVALTCWNHVYAIDFECLCGSMSSTTCPSCINGPSDVNKQLYFAWLAAYCYLDPGWSGLPASWNTNSSSWNTFQVGGIGSADFENYETSNPFTSQFITDNHYYEVSFFVPTCASGCDFLNSRWSGTYIDGDVVTGLAGANLLPDNYSIGGAPQSDYLYVDLTAVCTGWSWSDLQNSCNGVCGSPTGLTGLLVWLNSKCGDVADFAGMPSNWQDSLSFPNDTYPAQGSFPSWPSCLSSINDPGCQLSSIESNCTVTVCATGSVDQSGNCDQVPAINLTCFCPQINYETSCTNECALSWQRASRLNWINDTCSVLGSGTSLPSNWTSLLLIQRSEILPWGWNISSSAIPQSQCPAAWKSLVAFLVVNLFMLLLIPILGRRTVVKKITFGFFGGIESRHWYYTGPLAVGLHLASNAVNASIIKGVPGYENTSIGHFTLLWCTRPRLAWLVVALLPYQAEKSMYFSATASILFSEVVLQLIGSYSMGKAANYARIQEFLLQGHLAGSHFAKEAAVMYGGSLLWLTAVPFAIAACIWTIFGVSERINRFSEYWIWTRKCTRDNCAIVSTQIQFIRTARSKVKPPREGVGWQFADIQQSLLVSIDAVIEKWGKLNETWKNLPQEIRREQNRRLAAKKREERAKDLLEGTRQGNARWTQRSQAYDALRLERRDLETNWFSNPETKQRQAQTKKAAARDSIVIVRAHKDAIQTAIVACEQRILVFENAIARIEARIAAANHQLMHIKQRLRNLKWKWPCIHADDDDEVLQLNSQHDSISRQCQKDMAQLDAMRSDPQLVAEKTRAGDLQSVLDIWEALCLSKENLMHNWDANVQQWELIAEKRREQDKKENLIRFPVAIVTGMLLCWIAQWLWWAGYVEVAGDRYCPPKLSTIASVWTVFAATGSMVGASF